MARRCGCASEQCSCVIAREGAGIVVTGTGAPSNPFVINSTVTDVDTGFDVQYNNVDVIHDVHRIDFRGSAVTVTPGSDEAVVSVTVPDPVTGAVIPTGAIWMYGAVTEPSGWLLCDGRAVSRTTYANLFSVIGSNFGPGDGATTFGLPNLTDRMPIGVSGSKPINGVPGGSATRALSTANVPAHTHTVNHNHPAFNTSSDGAHVHGLQLSDTAGASASMHRGSGTFDVGSGPVISNGAHVHSVNIGQYTGDSGPGFGCNGAAFDIMPPWRALAFIIKT